VEEEGVEGICKAAGIEDEIEFAAILESESFTEFDRDLLLVVVPGAAKMDAAVGISLPLDVPVPFNVDTGRPVTIVCLVDLVPILMRRRFAGLSE
jgi:hypothetical protein